MIPSPCCPVYLASSAATAIITLIVITFKLCNFCRVISSNISLFLLNYTNSPIKLQLQSALATASLALIISSESLSHSNQLQLTSTTLAILPYSYNYIYIHTHKSLSSPNYQLLSFRITISYSSPLPRVTPVTLNH